MPCSEARSIRSPSREMPEPYMMSNSTSLKGGATLFFTTLTRVRLPTTASPFLMAPMRRMSRRCDGVELERVAAGGGLGVAEHHADLHADLVDEDDAGLALGDGAGELAQRLAHQAGLHAHVGVAHLALELGLGHQRGHRVDHQHVDGAGAHQHLGDLQALLAGVRLGERAGRRCARPACGRSPRPSRARRRCSRRRRRSSAPRPRCGGTGSSCRRTPARRSR